MNPGLSEAQRSEGRGQEMKEKKAEKSSLGVKKIEWPEESQE